MNDLLEKKFFPFVIKPGRYAGGEPGQIVKEPAGRVNYLHAFPDKYESGQGDVGLQTIYHILNSDDRFLCERVFAVDSDAEELMRREGIPLFSLESRRPAMEFDAIGFTLPNELTATTMLSMLDLAGIPLLRQQRNGDHPIIMAAGSAAYTPEPFSDFIDLFFIGDAEEGLVQMLEVLHENSGRTRTEKLEAIVRSVESVYIPAFYDDDRKPIVDFAPETIKARLIPDLKSDYYPDRPLVPLIDIAHNYLSVEIMRDCPRGSRYCHSGPTYRPGRIRSLADIMKQVETQLDHSGYDKVTMFSLSSSDFPEIDKLTKSLTKGLTPRKTSIALRFPRPGILSGPLLDAMSAGRKVGLTLAPEAGSERLRQFVRKDFSDQAIYDTVRLAFDRGWTTIRLQFLIGLPTETDNDLLAICDMVKNIFEIGRNYQGNKNIIVTLSPFVPEGHTPFQWDEACSIDEIERKIAIIKSRRLPRSVQLKLGSSRLNVLRTIIGRGGREMGTVIKAAFDKGCRFDGWSDHFQWDAWVETMADNNVEIERYLQPIPFSASLPWSHISKGMTVEELQKERSQTSIRLKEHRPKADVENNPNLRTPAIAYGRARKKVTTASQANPTRNRVRVMWGKSSRYRYMSHLDNIRMIERAIRCARLPVAYSQGFTPSMKLSFGPPLPLGFTSECELVDITFDGDVLPLMMNDLQERFPEGIILHQSRVIHARAVSLSAAINWAVYTLSLKTIRNAERLEEKAAMLMVQTSVDVERKGKSGSNMVDIRPAIYELSVLEDQLRMTLGLGEGGYARPSEVLQLLADNGESEYLANTVHRKEMYRIDDDGNKTYAMEL